MCTVTYLPKPNGCIITSNRDERGTRKPALVPQVWEHGNTQMIYPKDQQAGGTWIAANSNGHIGVLLNGSFKPHDKAPAYRMSRGLLLPQLLQSADPSTAINLMDLHGIEPFTIILFTGTLSEYRWDATKLHLSVLNPSIPHIWSSVTLYAMPVINKRESWFANWQLNRNNISMDEIIKFHKTAGEGDSNNDVLMNRKGSVSTVSITSMQVSGKKVDVKYYDVSLNATTKHELLLNASVH